LSFIDYLGPFLLLLGVLVVIHELGHFAVAKWFNVKCERFSVGFGPSLLRRKIGETEYVLAWLPLGGYVKMLGESPDEELSADDEARSFYGQSPLRRIGIALAGPGMNVLLSIVVIGGMYMTGWPTPTSQVGSVSAGSAAEAAGLLAGDRIVAVEGREIWRWSELTEAIQASDGKSLALEIERRDEQGMRRLDVVATPERKDGRLLLGIEQQRALSIVAVPDPDTPAGRAGLQTGDRVVALGGERIVDWYTLVAAVEGSAGDLPLEVERRVDGETAQLRMTVPGEGSWTLTSLGVHALDFAVRFVEPASPARRAGIERGDIPLRFGGQPIVSFDQFSGRIRGSGGRTLRMTVLRDGREVDLDVTPLERTRPVDGEVQTFYAMGVQSGMPRTDGEMREDTILNPVRALWTGAQRTYQVTAATLYGLSQLLTAKIGVENLAGPIGIGEIAADSFAEEGWFSFLWIMCVISVNLAILNLLPIPILDGGHIMFALAESVRGGPVSVRAREIAQTVGLSLVVLLMGFAFWNDLSKHWQGIVGWFKGLV
jgi:regulator of sigma E protease